MQYSLVHRELEREHVPLAEHFGLGIIPWSPLAGGFLTGKYRKGAPPPTDGRYAADKWQKRLAGFDNERNWTILDALDAASAELSAPQAAIALAWALQRPAITSVIFGARSIEQLDDVLKADGLVLPEEWMDCLNYASAFDLGYPYTFIQGIQGSW